MYSILVFVVCGVYLLNGMELNLVIHYCMYLQGDSGILTFSPSNAVHLLLYSLSCVLSEKQVC